MAAEASSPRVIQVISPSKLAGAERLLLRLLRHSLKRHGQFKVVTTRSPAEAELKAAGLDFETVDFGGKINLFAVKRLQRVAQQAGADLTHSHLSSASWWCGWLTKVGGPPSIGHVHGFTSALWHRYQSHLIACSHAVKDDLVSKGVPNQNISVLHNALSVDDIRATKSRAAVRGELGVGEEKCVIGTFGHLSPKKGYWDLLLAAREVLTRKRNVVFWCFGGGPLKVELQEQAAAWGIADRFKLWGFRRDVGNLMPAIDVMALPSHREPFGLVYLEAAHAAKPVIACNAGGAPEVVVHGTTGLLVPPRDPMSLSESLLALIEDRGLADRLGSQAFERVQDCYRWDTYLNKLRAIYDVVRESPSQLNQVGS